MCASKNTAKLSETLDQLLKKNQQLMKRNQHVLDEIGSVRNTSLISHIPAKKVHALDLLVDKNQRLRAKNRELVDKVAAVRNRLSGSGDAPTKLRAEKISAKIAAWIVSRVRRALR